MMKVFRIPLRVHLSDVDHAGIVYYPNIFQYLNVALEEFFGRQVGVDYPTMVLEHRIGLPTVRLETDFRHPMRFGDKFDVEIAVEKVGKTSIVFGYTILNSGTEEIAVRGRKVTVCLDLDQFKKTHIPQWLRDKLEALQQDSG